MTEPVWIKECYGCAVKDKPKNAHNQIKKWDDGKKQLFQQNHATYFTRIVVTTKTITNMSSNNTILVMVLIAASKTTETDNQSLL